MYKLHNSYFVIVVYFVTFVTFVIVIFLYTRNICFLDVHHDVHHNIHHDIRHDIHHDIHRCGRSLVPSVGAPVLRRRRLAGALRQHCMALFCAEMSGRVTKELRPPSAGLRF